MDYYTYNILYPGRAENNFFLNFSDVEHKMLMEESTKYNLGVILEKVKYIPKDFGNTREMAFFKVLNQNESHILR
ncbi:MAG: hypothetical protein EOP33_06640 [Rickettsiaceae bacterium]|nr:MAG: hypothetical protein EOP33_06640 [Rickettsiaceae bacterium]